MAEHTPGPWHYLPGTKTLAAGERGTHVAYIEEGPGLGYAAVANARLIAAAPELLAALDLIDTFAWSAVKADCEEARVELDRRVAVCRAAIAKARGEAQ